MPTPGQGIHPAKQEIEMHKATLTKRLGVRPFHIECSCGPAGDFFDKASALQWMGIHKQRVEQGIHTVEIVDLSDKAPTVSSAPGQGSVKIAVQPQSQTVRANQRVVFSVQAVGETPLHYQWMESGQPIEGQVAASFAFDALPEDTGAQFTVLVKNLTGEVKSDVATLTVIGPAQPLPPPPPAPPKAQPVFDKPEPPFNPGEVRR
jgi:hypothetical protein